MSIEYINSHKDGFEKAGDYLLRVPRLAFGRRFQVVYSGPFVRASAYQELPVDKVTRVVAAILTLLFFPITLPLALVGYACTRLSETYGDCPREVEAAHAVFVTSSESNPMLKEILGHLPTSDLVAFRGVNRAFRSNAMRVLASKSVLTKRELLQVMAYFKVIPQTDLRAEHKESRRIDYFPDLKKVDLSHSDVDDDTLQEMVAFLRVAAPNLSELDLSWCKKVTDTGFEGVSQLKSLRGLYLRSTHVTDTGLALFSPLINLRVLNLGSCCNHVTDAGLVNLSPLTNLTMLDLSYSKLTDAGVVHLSPLTSLEVLDLSNCKWWHQRADFSAFRRLRELKLSSCCFGPQDCYIPLFSLNTNLTSLEISYSTIGNLDGLLRNLSETVSLSLTSLNLSGFRGTVTETGLKDLSRLTSLEVLNLEDFVVHTAFSGLSQAAISALDSLSASGLDCLSALTSLKALVITKRYSLLTNKDLEDLSSRLPNLEIKMNSRHY